MKNNNAFYGYSDKALSFLFPLGVNSGYVASAEAAQISYQTVFFGDFFGESTNPPKLNNRSTGALDGEGMFYFTYNFLRFGN